MWHDLDQRALGFVCALRLHVAGFVSLGYVGEAKGDSENYHIVIHHCIGLIMYSTRSHGLKAELQIAHQFPNGDCLVNHRYPSLERIEAATSSFKGLLYQHRCQLRLSESNQSLRDGPLRQHRREL